MGTGGGRGGIHEFRAQDTKVIAAQLFSCHCHRWLLTPPWCPGLLLVLNLIYSPWRQILVVS